MQERQVIAHWNPTRDRWETGQGSLFSEHSDVFSEILPTSGMTRSGSLFPLPQLEHHTAGNGSLSSPTDEMPLLRTPAAAEAEGGALSPARARRENRTLRLSGQILDLIHPGSVK